MKSLNLILFASLLAVVAARVRLSDASLGKQSRRLEDTSALKISKNVATRSAKSNKVAKRKLISGTGFGLLTGAAGIGLMRVGRGTQEKEIKDLKTSLEVQRMMLSTKEAQRTAVLNEINRHVDDTFEKFTEYRSALLSKVEEFNTFIQSKLKAYGIVAVKGGAKPTAPL